jgi:hypothetical protein
VRVGDGELERNFYRVKEEVRMVVMGVGDAELLFGIGF